MTQSTTPTPSVRNVMLAQPVHQHAYETAQALDEGGILGRFVTGMYDTGRGVTSRAVLERLPSGLRSKVEREFGRRRHPELDPARVHTISRYSLAEMLLRRGVGVDRLQVSSWASDRFDRAVARELRDDPHVAAIHGFEGTALHTFRAARSRGIATVLDVPAAHERYAAILREAGHASDDLLRRRVVAERGLADWYVTPSDFVDDCLVEAGIPRDRLVRIPYGVDAQRFSPSSGGGATFRVLYVGSIGMRKGVSYLLEAWRRLRLPRAELVLVGEPDAYGRQVLNEYRGSFRHVGGVPKSEVDELYRNVDAFVLPTLAEGYGLVVLEAMASAVPVVTTTTCGCDVRDGIEGYVVSPRDPDAIAERLRRLYDDRDAGRAMGERGRARVLEALTWPHYRERIRAFYDALLHGADPSVIVAAPATIGAERGLEAP